MQNWKKKINSHKAERSKNELNIKSLGKIFLKKILSSPNFDSFAAPTVMLS